MNGKDLRPRVCMDRDRKAVDFCLKNVRIGEPCTIVEVNGFGVKIVYYELLQKLKKITDNFVVNCFPVKSGQELRETLQDIKSNSKPQIVVFYLASEEDLSWFVRELEFLRDVKSTDLIPIILSRVGDVYEALATKQKLLFRSLLVLDPIDLVNLNQLIGNFIERFEFRPTKRQIVQMYRLSGGHVGIIKSLYLYLKENTYSKLDLEEAIKIPAVQSRLEDMVRILPAELVKDMANYPNSKENKEFIEKYYFAVNGKVFSPLLKTYLIKYAKGSLDITDDEFKLHLTLAEKNLYEYQKNNINVLVGREEIAKIIWGNRWDEKYSEWAIDQTIHRLRIKLKKAKSPYKILTKKGEGFILREK